MVCNIRVEKKNERDISQSTCPKFSRRGRHGVAELAAGALDQLAVVERSPAEEGVMHAPVRNDGDPPLRPLLEPHEESAHPPHKVLPYPDRTPPGKPCTDCPNIIWALTDDQDVTLGGWEPMRQTQQLIESKGVTLNQWRIGFNFKIFALPSEVHS